MENTVKIAAVCPRCGADRLYVGTTVLRCIPFYSIAKKNGPDGKPSYGADDLDVDNDDLDYSYSDGKDWYACSNCGSSWDSIGELAKECSSGNMIMRETVM